MKKVCEFCGAMNSDNSTTCFRCKKRLINSQKAVPNKTKTISQNINNSGQYIVQNTGNLPKNLNKIDIKKVCLPIAIVLIVLIAGFLVKTMFFNGLKSDIIGTWRYENSQDEDSRNEDLLLIFNEDGTAIQRSEEFGLNEEIYSYKVENGILYAGESKAEFREVGEISIKDDVLTIKARNGETQKLNRVK